MRLPTLIVITDWQLPDIEEKLQALQPLADRIALQHRAPGMPEDEFSRRAEWLLRLGVPIFVNGRPAIAHALRTHVHVPGDLPFPRQPVRVRQGDGSRGGQAALDRDERWVSVAIHAGTPPERAMAADLALVSPVFSPGSKPSDTRTPLGPEGFARIAASLPCPAYALGGITARNIGQLKSAAGAAVISSVLKAADPLAAATELLAALGDAP